MKTKQIDKWTILLRELPAFNVVKSESKIVLLANLTICAIASASFKSTLQSTKTQNRFHTYMREVRNTKKKTYRVQDVGFAAAVQSGDGVEQRVKAVYLGSLCVGLESIDNNRLDVHL